MDPFTCDDARHLLDRRIASAWAALHGARAACSHSPSADNCAVEDMCENTVNDLLDSRWSGMSPIERRNADKREIRATEWAH